MIDARIEREKVDGASSRPARRRPTAGAPGLGSVAGVLGLQSRIGNRAVGRLVAARRMLARQDRHVVNGSQVMGFQNGAHAFAHYTYDVVQTAAGRQRDNEHLTIENSLVTLIAALAKDPDGVATYMQKRPGLMKPDHTAWAQAYGYSGTDNVNFRPARAVQGLRALPAAGIPPQVTPKTAASGAVDVESDFTLQNFLDFVDRIFACLRYAGAAQVRASIGTVAGWMGRQPGELFLNSSQQMDFATLVLTALDAVAAHRAREADENEPRRYGGPLLRGLTENPPRIVINSVTGEYARALTGLSEDILSDIRRAVQGPEGKWERRLGEQLFNEVRTHLIQKAWRGIKQQARTEPAVPAPVAVGH